MGYETPAQGQGELQGAGRAAYYTTERKIIKIEKLSQEVSKQYSAPRDNINTKIVESEKGSRNLILFLISKYTPIFYREKTFKNQSFNSTRKSQIKMIKSAQTH